MLCHKANEDVDESRSFKISLETKEPLQRLKFNLIFNYIPL